MRATEFATETQELDEISRITAGDYRGGKSSLYAARTGKQIRRLPGGSGLLYSTDVGRFGGVDIKLWDPQGQDYLAQKDQQKRNLPGQLIGKLTLETADNFPLKGALQVATITVDEDYRGSGLAKALYGIVLTILKRPLLAGSMQTPGGRKNWVSLSQIPGVEMKGFFAVGANDLTLRKKPQDSWERKQNKNVDAAIDTIMGQLGGQYLGKSPRGSEYFAFDVRPNTTGKELEAHVKQKLANVYGYSSGAAFDNGLYAVWTGQA